MAIIYKCVCAKRIIYYFFKSERRPFK